MTAPGGTQTLMRGRWVEGMRGTQFHYWSSDGAFTGTFSAADPNRIRVVGGVDRQNAYVIYGVLTLSSEKKEAAAILRE